MPCRQHLPRRLADIYWLSKTKLMAGAYFSPCPAAIASSKHAIRFRAPVALMPTCSARPTAYARSFRSEEHTSELQSLMRISYAVFCLKKKRITNKQNKQERKQ